MGPGWGGKEEGRIQDGAQFSGSWEDGDSTVHWAGEEDWRGRWWGCVRGALRHSGGVVGSAAPSVSLKLRGEVVAAVGGEPRKGRGPERLREVVAVGV